jgi:hypothetical protein
MPSVKENSTMLRLLVGVAGFLASVSCAQAVDYPARTPGLWQLEITPDLSGFNLPPLPPKTAKQCIDATVDQLFWQRDLGQRADPRLCRPNVTSSNGTITAEYSCSVADTSFTMRMVTSGDYKRSYTTDITSTQAPIRGVTPPPIHVTTTYKYIGPCEADQRPGDFITAEGTKIHLLMMRRRAISRNWV